jgi:hypothetical protein
MKGAAVGHFLSVWEPLHRETSNGQPDVQADKQPENGLNGL